MKTIQVNTMRKASRIIGQLKKQGRRAWFEQFCGIDDCKRPVFYYVVFYKEV